MTTKSNKELAVEITIAMINANPRVLQNRGNREDVVLSYKSDQIVNIINKIYNTLKGLDKNQTSIATEEEQN